MKVFFDTSVLMASFWLEHPGHAASTSVFHHATPSSAFCGLHSLAEFYAGITALPVRNRFDPQQTSLYVDEIRHRCTMIALTENEYADTIEQASARGFKSGTIYDALLLRCAGKAEADVIYTWNLKHFRAIAPELIERIRTP